MLIAIYRQKAMVTRKLEYYFSSIRFNFVFNPMLCACYIFCIVDDKVYINAHNLFC